MSDAMIDLLYYYCYCYYTAPARVGVCVIDVNVADACGGL